MNPTLEQLVGSDVWKTVGELHALEAAIRSLRLELERAEGSRPVSLVVEACAQEFGVPVDAVRGRCRTLHVAMARQVAMTLAKEVFVASASEVGRMFGRDHGTVLWAERSVTDAVATCKDTARKVEALRRRLRGLSPQSVLPLCSEPTLQPSTPINLAA